MEAARPVMTEAEEASLWRQAHAGKDGAARLVLIDRYTSVARSIAARYYRSRPDDDVEFGDYLQYAMVGLIESVDRYDPDSEASFATFAGYRIKGALLNGLEKSTERREQYALRRRYQRERLDSIRGDGGSRSDKDVFSEMVDVAVELALSYMLEDSGLVEKQGAEDEDVTYRGKVLDELRLQLAAIVDRLPERERLLIRNHNFHSVSFDDLGRLLGVSKGRVSQLHKRALQLIKAEYENGNGLDAYF